MKKQLNLKEIFADYIKNKKIFKNKNALTIQFTPENILHREEQIKQLGMILAPVLKEEKPSNIFIYGKPGTGKSLCIRYVTNVLLNEAIEHNIDNLKIIYVNCRMHKVADTEYRLLSQVLYNFNINVPYTGLPTDELYRTFFNVIQSNPLNILLILDEIDYLVNKIGDNILYNLTRINEKLSKSKLTIIGISNNSTFINNLDPRVKSSLSEEEIIFPSYNANELKDILIDRIEIAFHPDTVTPQAIAKCAALAAQEHGDARKALDLIRVAGEIAERSGDNKVTEKHVDMAEKKLDIDKTFEILKTQPRQSQIVYFAIIKLIERGAKNILTGDVYDEYIKACERNGIRALTQRRVSDLISELEMIGMINCKVISLGRYGRTREIRINMPKTVFEKIKRFLEKEFI